MGIPKFYRWISERYPCLSQVVQQTELPEYDNFYLDMNGIIHHCSHPNDDNVHFRISEEQIVKNIFNYVTYLFNLVQPKKVFFMAVDGVAPRAKMNQQRGRRFKTARDADKKEKEAISKGEKLPSTQRFDSNCITPGTQFMERLQKHLEYFVAMKVSTDELWRGIDIYLSGHQTPGEGEHKIMDFIRLQRSQPNYNPATSHCVYGLDADLILLGLSSHEPLFSLLREEIRFDRPSKSGSISMRSVCSETFHLLHLSLFRDYIDHEFSSLKSASLSFSYNLENIIDDVILISFLCGNDFIPHIPTFHLHKNSLGLFFDIYRLTLPHLDGYLNEAGNLNLPRFQKFVQALSNVDLANYNGETSIEVKQSPRKTKKKVKNVTGSSQDDEDYISCESNDENASDSDDELTDSSLEREFVKHKRTYYIEKLNYRDVDRDVLIEQANGYIRAIQWNLHYYYQGCASWSWYFPHHYSPYISDVKDFNSVDLSFERGEPFKPFEQLLGVLPPASQQFLPEAYRTLVNSANSPLIEYYPRDFETDLNGKRNDWESVVKIPFIDQKIFMDAIKDREQYLSEEDKKRNVHGPHLHYFYSEKIQEPLKSTLPGSFDDITRNHAKCVAIDKNGFVLHSDEIKRGFNPNFRNDLFYLGFPRLDFVQHTSELKAIGVKVFQMPSRESSIVLKVTEKPFNIDQLAELFLGKKDFEIYVDWPIVIKSRVSKLFSAEYVYTSDAHGQVHRRKVDSKEEASFRSSAKNMADKLKESRGIILPPIKCLVFVNHFRGYRMLPFSEKNVTTKFEGNWATEHHIYPIETCVWDVNMTPLNRQVKTIETFYKKGSRCFLLDETNYGEMGEIIGIRSGDNWIKVKFTPTEQPDISDMKDHCGEIINKHFMNNKRLAQQVGISDQLASRITGSVFVRDTRDPNRKSNLGLNIKYISKNMNVSGYSLRVDGNVWLFSNDTLNILKEYKQKYPEVFRGLQDNISKDFFEVKDFFNSADANIKFKEVCTWLRSLPCQSAEKRSCDAEVVEACVVEGVEDTFRFLDFVEDRKASEPTYIHVPPSQIYLPSLHRSEGHCPPDPNADFNLFDFVVNVRLDTFVPLGALGVVIGKSKDKNNQLVLDVIFEKEFNGGLQINCKENRAFRLTPNHLINISLRKRNKPNVSKQDSNCIQQDRRQRYWKPGDGQNYAGNNVPQGNSAGNYVPQGNNAGNYVPQGNNVGSYFPSSNYDYDSGSRNDDRPWPGNPYFPGGPRRYNNTYQKRSNHHRQYRNLQ